MPTFMPNTYDASRGITYFQAMIGQANYFNSRPADPGKAFPAPFPGDLLRQPYKDNAVEPVVRKSRIQLQGQPRPARGIDVRTGKRGERSWSPTIRLFRRAGTAGGLLLMGDIMGKISAFDKTPCRSCGASISKAIRREFR